MKYIRYILLLFIVTAVLGSCKKDNTDQPVPANSTIDNIEIGLNNNEMGVIGRDFHFNAEVLAGDKIESVIVRIQPKPGETYAKPWQHEVIWTEYKDAKNATVHKHFDVPTDAVEGKYDFLIIVNDQNGSKLEVKRSITIYSASNLPVDPAMGTFNIYTYKFTTGLYFDGTSFTKPGTIMVKDEMIKGFVRVNRVKGDGKMYLLLVPKKLNHRPESIAAIDFNKVIVYDVCEHVGWVETKNFSNSNGRSQELTDTRRWPELVIGAPLDNNIPQRNPITAAKKWSSGDYYFGAIYHNTTYNITLFRYIEFPLTF